jgi:hypothetical protein
VVAGESVVDEPRGAAMSGWISTEKPLTYAWAMQHEAYHQGVQAGKGAAMEDGVRHDRDETRRLLYMAMYVSRTERYNLVGTLVNALAHHGSGLDPDEIGEHVVAAVEDGDLAWVRAQIARLTAEENDAKA